MLNELLKQINAYLTGQVSVQQLEDWTVSHLQSVLDSKDSKAIDLADKIDADLVQFDEGIFDEKTLKDRLQSYSLIAGLSAVSYSIIAGTGDSTITKAGNFISENLTYPNQPIIVSR